VNWQIAKRSHGLENRFETFDAPIVADEQEHEILIPKIAALACVTAESGPCGRRKLRRVHAVGDDLDIPPVKILGQQSGSALGDGRERNFRVGVDAAFQGSQKRVVSAAMETPEKPRPGGFAFIISGKLLETMEKRVNDDHFGVEAINSGRKHEVETEPMNPAIPSAAKRIEKQPPEKFQQVGPRNGRNLVPEDGAGIRRERCAWLIEGQVLDALSIEMDFTVLLAREAFQQFGEGTLRAMAAVNKR